ncbi:hypothetical protein [uncultured Flavobacterium sp.]|uniref:hypothetical protein n=1 Tax=uncultured Flavobacterium sp. TaxID=165435 RepID=UPI0025CC7F9E|nr:hypothetical protein [uncultured Flavobacterium sp.]
MENNVNEGTGNYQGSQQGRELNNNDSRLEEIKNLKPDPTLPYDDPAVVNPQELATFPKKSEIMDAADVDAENEFGLVNRRSPVREGRNIVRTDNDPNNDGFM